jgi:hypothetical protein
VSGGAPVAVEGTELPLWGMEIDVERAKAELRELGQAGASGSSKVEDCMSGVGLGALQEQLKDLRLSALRAAARIHSREPQVSSCSLLLLVYETIGLYQSMCFEAFIQTTGCTRHECNHHVGSAHLIPCTPFLSLNVSEPQS